jgi:hypothetical protein
MEGEFEKSNVVSGSGGAWAELIDVEPFVDSGCSRAIFVCEA